ncbi:uncharacterized protein LOC128668181 [Microplitis demolitor]|uniref:uncharacterized protein LOC128668181 n=1 Tax=Microplitis demolitor TaxID=69319 RepID=UPI0004CD5A41|nr:uncharacterized protein LOC128668181 [Microplitis demolitor]
MRKTLVNALIQPHINYCSAVIYGLSSVLDGKLQRLANKGIRFVLGLPWDAQITQARKDLNWLTVRKARARSVLNIIWAAIHEHTPSYLAELISVYTSARVLRNQSAAITLTVPNHRTSSYKAAFAVTAPYLWNSLPDDVKLVPDFASL